MEKLTEIQLKRIIKRFISRQSTRSYIRQPHQTTNNIVATDGSITLFLSKDVVASTVSSNYASSQKTATITQLEDYHMNHSAFDPSTSLTLNNRLMKSIINRLSSTQKELYTNRTQTKIEYYASSNDLILTTIPAREKFLEWREDTYNKLYCKPTSVARHREGSFSFVVNSKYLIDALLTQRATGEYTAIEYDASQRDYIKLENDVSTIIISHIKN